MLEGILDAVPIFNVIFSKSSLADWSCSYYVPCYCSSHFGVVACGPVAMVQSINHICNLGSNLTSDSIFTFTEDDWE